MEKREHVGARIRSNGESAVAFGDVRADRSDQRRAVSRDGERQDVLEEAASRECETIDEGFSPGEPDTAVGLGRECEEADDIGSPRWCLEEDPGVATNGIIVLGEHNAVR